MGNKIIKKNKLTDLLDNTENVARRTHVDHIHIGLNPSADVNIDRNSLQLCTISCRLGTRQIIVRYESDNTYELIKSDNIDMKDYPAMSMERDHPTARSTGELHSVKPPFGGSWNNLKEYEINPYEQKRKSDWKWKNFLEGPSLCPRGETLQQISLAKLGTRNKGKFSQPLVAFMKPWRSESFLVDSENNKFEKKLEEYGLTMKDPCEINHLKQCIIVSNDLRILINYPGPAEDYTPDVSQFTPGSIGHIVYEMMILRYHVEAKQKDPTGSFANVRLNPAAFVKLLSTKNRFHAITTRFLESKLEFRLSGGGKLYLS